MNIAKLILTIAITIACSHVYANQLTGIVVGISDGDTITVLDSDNKQFKIRLSGIDAPEKDQPYGQVSKQSLSDMIYNQTVTVDYYKQDRYGRLLGKILLKGQDINLEQIKRGLAWHYKKYQKEQTMPDMVRYADEEVNASARKKGLWAEKAIPPWEWRHKLKSI